MSESSQEGFRPPPPFNPYQKGAVGAGSRYPRPLVPSASGFANPGLNPPPASGFPMQDPGFGAQNSLNPPPPASGTGFAAQNPGFFAPGTGFPMQNPSGTGSPSNPPVPGMYPPVPRTGTGNLMHPSSPGFSIQNPLNQPAPGTVTGQIFLSPSSIISSSGGQVMRPAPYQSPPPPIFGAPPVRPPPSPQQQAQPGVTIPQPGISAPLQAQPGYTVPQPTLQQAQPGIPAPPQARTGYTVPQPVYPSVQHAQQGYSIPPQSGFPVTEQHQVQSGYPQPGYAAQGFYTGPPPLPGQELVEDFESLSISSAPGTVDIRLDSLPRPTEEHKFVDPIWTNCHPRYLEFTTNAIPNSHSLAARWHLPLGAIIHPLAEPPPGEEVPVIDFGTSGIVRCRRCRTYVNPYVQFVDNGRFWRCLICNLLNEVPHDYLRDPDEKRPELSCGSVDFVAPMEYMVRPPMPPTYFFLIDVSIFSVRSGMLQVAVDTIKACLDKLPGFPRTQIGLLTFDSVLHFYSLKSSLTQPQMVVMAQLDDPFLPMPDDLIVNLSESRAVVESLLDSLPSVFANTDNVESALGPALQITTQLMEKLGGKLLIFQSTLPSLGVGRLKPREDPRLYGTEKEHTLRISDDQFYKHMAAECSKMQIGVNIYAFSEKYIDVASLGTLAKYTGGQVCYYPGFDATVDAEKLRYDLARDLTRETAWEAVMRIRCGKGIRYSSFNGHFMLRSSDLLALPAVDCDKAFSVQFSLEETLLQTESVYFQVALLYTSSLGERRIRVHTAALPVTKDLRDMYRVANVNAIMGVWTRLALEKSLSDKLEAARLFVQNKLVLALREFKNMHGVKHNTHGRMIFPQSLKLLPLYVLCLLKSWALRGGPADANADERSAAGYEMMTMPIPRLMKLLYPSLFRLDTYLRETKSEEFNGTKQCPLTLEMFDQHGAFLLSDADRFVFWIGNSLEPVFIANLFGSQVAGAYDLKKVVVEEQPNDISKRFHALLDKLRRQNPACYQPCMLVRSGDAVREMKLVMQNLVEDRNAGLPAYAEWMVQIFRQTQQKI